MKQWTTLASVSTPDNKQVTLTRHDNTFVIRVDGMELMSTRRHASEETLAHLACAHAAEIPGARVLVGGLGFGFTLRAALAVLRPDATVIAAELLPAVIAWNSDPAFPLAADALSDPRVTILAKDVADVIAETIAEAANAFDAIILDVDNGPAALTSEDNRRLYDYEGLLRIRAALRPGGCAAFWSAAPDPAFEKQMLRAGFSVSVERARPHPTSGGWHTLFLGRLKSTQ